ncbi:hypothetical protein QLQ12_29805 [Actinoplanes sp. NEAU-A12]|uniref:Uncharacterized protein n=1 Tax=Actinoplanes sandaracinus TaxID=3045177 RepID=A0ABT6WSU6_9ACTN|nr:hypothetical protein [Actinoplanes sandaracinus]MDI6102821.1 hypothetical protein [Actinoplanes sandaracinus]
MASVASVGARTASADDGPATPETAEQAAWWAQEGDLWRRQALLADLKTWIVAQPGIETSGYIESVNNPEAGSTILLWKGPANHLQQQIKDKARQMGIPVTVEQRRYSRDEIDRAQQAISDAGAHGVFTNFRVTGIGGVAGDIDGITVYGEYITPPAGDLVTADAALAAAATAQFGITIAIKSGVGPMLT